MIQVIINSTLLRELDERKLINAYAHLFYNSEKDTTNDYQIKQNLIQLLDWDENGDNGLGIYCSKFESIKERDWLKLIQFIKSNHHEIKTLSYSAVKKRKLESVKVVNTALEAKRKYNIERYTDSDYKVSGRGKKAKPCIYKGKQYKSQQECIYKEGLSKYEMYKYLKETNQL